MRHLSTYSATWESTKSTTREPTSSGHATVDLIGPLYPPSARKHQYILTMVDMATRYPKAEALVNIDTVSVAEALLKMFSDTGIPQEILSDRGTQFTSDVMKEVHRLLSIKSITTTLYHAQCNGLC